jgi:PAS domain S-box-containing protein
MRFLRGLGKLIGRASDRDVVQLASQWTTLLDSIGDAVYVVDRKYKVTKANRAAKKFALSFPESSNRTIYDLLGPEIGKKHIEICEQVFKTKTPTHIEGLETMPAGQTVYVSTLFSPLMNTRGEVIRIVSMIRDLSTLRSSELEMKKAKEAAESANRAKSSFLASMSHELRTPLGVIVGFSELLRTPGVEESSKSAWIEAIHRSAQHLLHLISDLLDLSTIDASQFKIDLQICSLERELNNVVQLLEPQAKSKGLQIEVTGTESLPMSFKCDPLRVRQILMNLIGNAIKYSDRGTISIHVSRDRKTIRFSVRDQGPGIKKADQSGLFEAFIRGKAQRGNKLGAGLGLFLSKKLAELMKGDVVLAASELGKGSEFCFWLEDTSELGEAFGGVENSITPILEIPDSQILKNKTLLIFEDNEENQFLLQATLKSLEADLIFVASGEEGIPLALQRNVDLVLMDIQLAGMSGYEAAYILRQKGFSKPIIAVTANAMQTDRDRCLAAGCSDYLSKPLGREQLIKKMVHWLSKPDG